MGKNRSPKEDRKIPKQMAALPVANATLCSRWACPIDDRSESAVRVQTSCVFPSRCLIFKLGYLVTHHDTTGMGGMLATGVGMLAPASEPF